MGDSNRCIAGIGRQSSVMAMGRKLVFARHVSGHTATYLPAPLDGRCPLNTLNPSLDCPPSSMLGWPVWDGDH